MKLQEKRYLKLLTILITLIIVVSPNIVFAVDYEQLCFESHVMNAMKIVGYVILVCRWVVPFIIIILGMIDFSKAVISNDDKALNKATAALIRRFVAGVSIFLIPTLIIAILNITLPENININSSAGEMTIGDTNFGHCTKCLFDPENCK